MEKFKKILTGIWKFLNSRLFVIILIVLLIMFAAGQCKKIADQNRDNQIHEQNESALVDSLKFERKKNGELLVSIDGYIATEKELKTLNTKLWKEVNDQKGKVISLTDVVIQLRQDSAMLAKTIDNLHKIIGKLTQINDSTFSFTWSLPYIYDSLNYDVFQGRSIITLVSKDPLFLRHKDTYLTNRETQINLDWGQKVEKGKLRIFVESSYPGFTVKSMEGVLIDPNTNPLIRDLMKPKKWFTGFTVGPSVTAGWDVIKAKPAVVVGISLHYGIYRIK